MNIRAEKDSDHREVFDLIQKAFENEAYSDHREHFLVERLRNSGAFIPELSLVAELNGQITGYILLTKIKIVNGDFRTPSLALAPVAVLPSYQHKGIGGQLIRSGHRKAKELGFTSIVVLGHQNYYPRFGYKMAKDYGIRTPFAVPDENSMIIELTADALKHTQGTIEYPQEFYE